MSKAATIEVPFAFPQLHGPFDLIGDLHGCADELETLLRQLGYTVISDSPGLALENGPTYAHSAGRMAVFVGDLVDRGPRILDTLRLVRNIIHHGSGLSVTGNHDEKLLRKLRGRNVQVAHGLEHTLAEIEALPDGIRETFVADLDAFLSGLPYQLVLDEGRLIVAHAGLKASLHGHSSPGVREFALYGQTTGQRDEYGLPIRIDWARDYTGDAVVVYGHTPQPEARWVNNTIDVDTGCIFGGTLTAARYPERTVMSVPAERVYFESKKPFPANSQIAHIPSGQPV